MLEAAEEKGISKPPQSFLREIRRLSNRHFKSIVSHRKRHSSTFFGSRRSRGSQGSFEKRLESETTEQGLDKKSVVNYLMMYPDFLDSLIINHVSQDRVKAWLKESKEKSGESVKEETDQDWTAELMEKSFRHRQILMITRSRLFYPPKYKRDELNELIERPYSDEYEQEVESHLFPYTEVPPADINNVFIMMVKKLLGKFAFPRSELCYFLSCLRNNYHNIEYHNYSHALSHAQSMYWILSRNLGVFNELEVKSLMISAIAHDVGHAGVNDYYLKTTSSGLEKLYFSPILEHHHTQTTFLILQDINCNVFCNLEGDDYKMVLDEIQHDILSTSLARYKVQCENMRHIIATGLDFQSKKVRDAIKSVLMMTCDLCASWKSWQEHKNTVWSLYKEFFYQFDLSLDQLHVIFAELSFEIAELETSADVYKYIVYKDLQQRAMSSQGDKQTTFNIDSAPQMLRMNADKIPEYQVQFMENVLIPVFQIASKVFPNISEIVNCTKENLELWNTYI